MLISSKLETERFKLRTLLPKDASDEYLRWMKDEVVKTYIEAAKEEQSITLISNYIREKNKSTNCIFFGIFTKDLNIHIGNIKYEPINFHMKTAEMGVLIGNKDWRGKKVFDEVLTSTSNFLKKEYDINKIILGVDNSNIPAISAYKKAGFVFSTFQNDKNSSSSAMELII